MVLDVQVSRNKERLCRLESAVVEKRTIEERYDPSDISVFEVKCFWRYHRVAIHLYVVQLCKVTGLSSL